MSKRVRKRSYVFTINNYTFDDMAEVILLSDYSRYVIAGFEVGSQGTPHIQGYVYFDNPQEPKYVRKFLSRACIRIAKGSVLSNLGYCSDDGDYWESGDPPQQGKAKFRDIKYLMKNPETHFHLYTQYRKAYSEYLLTKKKDHSRSLLIATYDRCLDVADKFIEDGKTVLICDDMELYSNEDVVITEYFEMSSDRFHIDRWLRGYPPKFKRGYEVLTFDPEIIVLLYRSHNQYKKACKQYAEAFDGFL